MVNFWGKSGCLKCGCRCKWIMTIKRIIILFQTLLEMSIPQTLSPSHLPNKNHCRANKKSWVLPMSLVQRPTRNLAFILYKLLSIFQPVMDYSYKHPEIYRGFITSSMPSLPWLKTPDIYLEVFQEDTYRHLVAWIRLCYVFCKTWCCK